MPACQSISQIFGWPVLMTLLSVVWPLSKKAWLGLRGGVVFPYDREARFGDDSPADGNSLFDYLVDGDGI
jgi:hypothetical protein